MLARRCPRILAGAWVLLAAALAVACHRDQGAGRAPLALGIAIPSYVHAVAWIAHDHGELAREGLDAKVQVLGGSAATMRSLVAGSTDIAIAGGDAVLRADAAGADLVVVAGLVDRFYHRIVARRPIDKVEALKGKRVGLPFLGGPQYMAMRFALRRAGLVEGKDVKVLSMGREFDRMAALKRGDIDATTSQTPPAKLAELGLNVIADLPDENVPFPYAVVVARRDYVQKHPDRVRGTLVALCDAARFYRAKKAASLAIVEKHISGSDTHAAARRRYDTMGPKRITLPPRPDKAAFRTVINLAGDARVRAMQPDKVFDLAILEDLIRHGKCGAP